MQPFHGNALSHLVDCRGSRRIPLIVSLVCSTVFLSACHEGQCSQPAGTGRLRIAVEALQKAADDCLVDVRVPGVRFEASRNCAAMDELALDYFQAGGADAPCDIELVFHQARAVAWIAKATSLAGGASLAIW